MHILAVFLVLGVGADDVFVMTDGWKQSEFLFEIPLETVGFMIMADGDNTHSSFSSEIKNLHID